ncbi:hypothetical protein Tco_0641153 [Tanacetum coccineum]
MSRGGDRGGALTWRGCRWEDDGEVVAAVVAEGVASAAGRNGDGSSGVGGDGHDGGDGLDGTGGVVVMAAEGCEGGGGGGMWPESDRMWDEALEN